MLMVSPRGSPISPAPLNAAEKIASITSGNRNVKNRVSGERK